MTVGRRKCSIVARRFEPRLPRAWNLFALGDFVTFRIDRDVSDNHAAAAWMKVGRTEFARNDQRIGVGCTTFNPLVDGSMVQFGHADQATPLRVQSLDDQFS
jgi:hypothetical protein